MTVRPITTTDALHRAHLELNAAVNRLSQRPACTFDRDFTEEIPPGRALDLVAACNACPVFAECRVLAGLLPARDKVHTVMAGVQYGTKGRPVDLAAEVRRQDRDRSLTAAVELKAAS